MRRCESCNTKFTWRQIYHSFWLAYSPIHCKQCGTEHHITMPGRLTFILFMIIPFIIWYNYMSPIEHMVRFLLIGALIMALTSALAPFFVNYRKESKQRS